MANINKNSVIVAMVLALAAPAVQAEVRDTGVGRIIAAQGNSAMQQIRRELNNFSAIAKLPGKAGRPRSATRTAANGGSAALYCAS